MREDLQDEHGLIDPVSAPTMVGDEQVGRLVPNIYI